MLLGEVSIQEVWDHLLESHPSTTESGHRIMHGLLDTFPHRHKAVSRARILVYVELCGDAAPSGEDLPGALVGGGAQVAAHSVGTGRAYWCGSLLG